MLSDAWLEMAHALDEELGLSSWFALREEPVADTGGIVAELLGAETAALPPALVGDDLDAEAFETPATSQLRTPPISKSTISCAARMTKRWPQRFAFSGLRREARPGG
ncbi:hypothetical protein [Mesorhizobium sp. BR1-1-14]|uniref:hypothetical protein n=1 Tax=Mesorhizobium sp. BR1-1-14 TaxID=2876655 RepID=UPI001CD06A99|nr:hypothetical protein [Mesorhizobium sp. BR1-1-14]MBZ9960614.1 hypothetical protein [Mesorhizobium sp. BR1-1-14]